MTVDYLIDLFKGCEYIKGFGIGAGFLSDEINSVSVVPDGEEEIRRTYCDGAKIKSFGFSLIIRLASNMDDNSDNFSFLENICDWISSFDKFSDEFCYVPLGISIVRGATLIEDNIHSLKYEIKCRLEYLQE